LCRKKGARGVNADATKEKKLQGVNQRGSLGLRTFDGKPYQEKVVLRARGFTENMGGGRGKRGKVDGPLDSGKSRSAGDNISSSRTGRKIVWEKGRKGDKQKRNKNPKKKKNGS